MFNFLKKGNWANNSENYIAKLSTATDNNTSTISTTTTDNNNNNNNII
jgi:hypothetical protein